MHQPDLGTIASVRRFNRFYTRAIGVLGQSYLQPDFSLASGRVLYELATRDAVTALHLRGELGLDAGYLSRILKDFERRGYLTSTPSASDRRSRDLRLTEAGRQAFAALDALSQGEIATLLSPLTSVGKARLAAAMTTIQAVLQPSAKTTALTLRHPRPGDFGWVVQQHGALYAQEYGWDERFEALVARIVAGFVENFDARCERCWIAELDDRNVGSVFLVRESADVAKLRLLLVDPSARGLGLGRRLIAECIGFARQAGYRRLTLWTQQNLIAARRLYAEAGFTLTGSEPYTGIGRDLVSEYWDLDLTTPLS